MGAMLCMRNSIYAPPPVVRVFFAYGFGQLFFGRFALGFGKWVGRHADDEAQAFDQLGHTLQHQQRETDRHQQTRRPQHQTAGIGGQFLGLISQREYRPGQDQNDHGHGHEEKQDAEHVDPGLSLVRKMAGYHVYAHVFIALEGVRGAEQEHARKQIPLHFEEGVRTDVEQLARDGIDGADKYRDQHQPDHGLADKLVKFVDQGREPQQGFHDFPPVPG